MNILNQLDKVSPKELSFKRTMPGVIRGYDNLDFFLPKYRLSSGRNRVLIQANRIATIFLLMGVMSAMILGLDDTAELFVLGGVVVKSFPLFCVVLSLAIFVFTALGRWSAHFFLLLLFFMLIVCGSAYALLINNVIVEESYISRGMGMIVFFPFFFLAQIKQELRFFCKLFIPFLIAISCVYSIIIVLYRLGFVYGELTQLYQVQSVFIAMASVILFEYVRKPWLRTSLLFFYLLCLVLIVKTTAILLFTWAFGHISYAYFLRFRNALGISAAAKKLLSFAVGVAGVLLILFSFYFIIQDRMETRGDGTRTETFTHRINEFQDSPLFGSFFTSSPLVDYGPLHIPSHSDILDILAAGGLLSVILLFIPLADLLRKSTLLSVGVQSYSLRKWMAFTIIAHFIVMSVNPILFMPYFAFSFWMAIGILAGLVASNLDYKL